MGLLAQVSFLALHSHPGRSSPTLRGQAVREIFLCQRVPPPPPDIDFSLLQDTYNPDFRTTRDRLAEHRRNPACASCHNLTDPIGLTLEVFDAAGGYRTTENGAPIDASGELNGRTYAGPPGLAEALRRRSGTSRGRRPASSSVRSPTGRRGRRRLENGSGWRTCRRSSPRAA